jgi:hypothetical protein
VGIAAAPADVPHLTQPGTAMPGAMADQPGPSATA